MYRFCGNMGKITNSELTTKKGHQKFRRVETENFTGKWMNREKNSTDCERFSEMGMILKQGETGIIAFLMMDALAGRFRRISQGFCTFEGYFLHVTASRPSFRCKYNQVSVMGTAHRLPWGLHIACSRKVDGGRHGPLEGPRSHSQRWIYNLWIN